MNNLFNSDLSESDHLSNMFGPGIRNDIVIGLFFYIAT